MDVELGHGSRDGQAGITGNDPTMTVKIANVYLRELPDYHYHLHIRGEEANADAATIPLFA